MKTAMYPRVVDGLSRTLMVCLSFVAIGFSNHAGSVAMADMIFSDRATFEAGLPAGYYTDNFSNAPIAVGSPAISYTGGGGTPTIGYTFTAPNGGLFIGQLLADPTSKFIGPWEDTDDLLVSFNTANVYRVGLDISVEDAFSPVSRNVTIDFSSGATATINVPANTSFSFFGIYSDTQLSWMRLRAVGGGVFTNTARLTTAVPEPSSGLLAIGVFCSSIWRRRR